MKSSIQNLFLILALCAGTYPAAAQSFVVSSTNAVGGALLSVIAAGFSGYTINDDSTNKSLYIPTQPEGSAFFRRCIRSLGLVIG
jgi:hypothetical protein